MSVNCGACGTLLVDDPAHTGCLFGEIVSTLHERGHWITVEQIAELDIDVPDDLWGQWGGPAADWLEARLAEQTSWEGEPKGLVARHLYRNHGSRVQAGVEIGEGLMRGDPRLHKAGYTLENAVIAVGDAFRITPDVEELADDEISRITKHLERYEEELGRGPSLT